jgi:hypothetical protein
VVDVPTAPPVAPTAAEFPGRAGLTPGEQAAFDRFIGGKRAAPGGLSPEFEAKLRSATPDGLRRFAQREIAAQADVEASQAAQARAQATNQSDPLRPAMGTPLDEGDGVRVRFNESPPLGTEVTQAKLVAGQTGEPVELFGDGYRGIDGTIGDPPRPLQLKGPPASLGPAEVYRNAVVARTKAIKNGFSNVEVHIIADGLPKAHVAAEFAHPSVPGTYLDGAGSGKVVIHCAGGEVYLPPSQAMPILPPPAHVDEHDKTPVGAGSGG